MILRRGIYAQRNISSGIVTDGLVLNLDAGDSSSYPGTGTLWTDLSTSGNDAALVNGPTFSTDGGGNIVFDGVNDYASVVSSNWGTGSFSISMWFNAGTGLNTAGYQMLLGGSNYSTGGGSGIGHYLLNNTIKTWVYNGGSVTNIFTSSGVLTQSNWYNLVIVRELNSEWRWYLNDSLTGSNSTQLLSGSFSSPNSHISAHYNSPNNFNFNGSIAEVSIYDKALSVTEINQNYNALKNRFGL